MRVALRTQVPLTALMVVYTFLGLSIMAEPIVESRTAAVAAPSRDVAIPADALRPDVARGEVDAVQGRLDRVEEQLAGHVQAAEGVVVGDDAPARQRRAGVGAHRPDAGDLLEAAADRRLAAREQGEIGVEQLDLDVRGGAADHLEHHHPFGPLQLELFLNLLIHRPDGDPELFA